MGFKCVRFRGDTSIQPTVVILKQRWAKMPVEWNRAQQIELDQLNNCMGEKMSPDPYLTPHANIYDRWTSDPNVKNKRKQLSLKIAPNWKQPKFSSTVEQINKLLYIHTAIRKGRLLLHATMWMNFTIIMLNERGQIQKDIYYMILLWFYFYKVQTGKPNWC